MYSFLIYFSITISILLYVAVALVPYLVILLLPEMLRAHLMRTVTLYLGKTVIGLGLRPFIRIRYIDAVGGDDPPGIYVCNHRAATDAFLMALFGKEIIQIVNGWPMKLPFFGFNARKSGYIDSTRTAPENYAPIIESLIQRGVSVVAFPEGTRSGSRKINQFHSGIFYLARQLKVPVYPCCIAGNEFFPDRSFKFHRSRQIIVKRLPPILPEQYLQYPSAFIFKKRIQETIAQELSRLDDEINS